VQRCLRPAEAALLLPRALRQGPLPTSTLNRPAVLFVCRRAAPALWTPAFSSIACPSLSSTPSTSSSPVLLAPNSRAAFNFIFCGQASMMRVFCPRVVVTSCSTTSRSCLRVWRNSSNLHRIWFRNRLLRPPRRSRCVRTAWRVMMVVAGVMCDV
jgi:hypothetical protein